MSTVASINDDEVTPNVSNGQNIHLLENVSERIILIIWFIRLFSLHHINKNVFNTYFICLFHILFVNSELASKTYVAEEKNDVSTVASIIVDDVSKGQSINLLENVSTILYLIT